MKLGNNWKSKKINDGLEVLIRDTEQITAEEINDNGDIIYDVEVKTGKDNEIVVNQKKKIPAKYNIIQELGSFSKSESLDMIKSKILEELRLFSNSVRRSIKTEEDLLEIAGSTGNKFQTTTSYQNNNIFQTKKAMEKFLKTGYDGKTVQKILEVIY